MLTRRATRSRSSPTTARARRAGHFDRRRGQRPGLGSGIDPTYLGYIESGEREASLAVLSRVAAALGADVSLRIYPNTGPAIRDPHPGTDGRGVPRVAAHELAPLPRGSGASAGPRRHRPRDRTPVVGSSRQHRSAFRLRRLEQQLRWAAEKTDALPSAAVWPALTGEPSRVRRRGSCSCRSTTSTRSLARSFPATFAAAYPADPRRAPRRAPRPRRDRGPGTGMLWVDGRGRARRRSSAGVRAASRRSGT